MLIVNQDQDKSYVLSTKDIFYRPHFTIYKFKLIFCGWNLYGRTGEGKELLGTFDSRQACKITKAEIKQHEKAGMLSYIVSEESDIPEDLIEAECDQNV
jgi:hypothetical protein